MGPFHKAYALHISKRLNALPHRAVNRICSVSFRDQYTDSSGERETPAYLSGKAAWGERSSCSVSHNTDMLSRFLPLLWAESNPRTTPPPTCFRDLGPRSRCCGSQIAEREVKRDRVHPIGPPPCTLVPRTSLHHDAHPAGDPLVEEPTEPEPSCSAPGWRGPGLVWPSHDGSHLCLVERWEASEKDVLVPTPMAQI